MYDVCLFVCIHFCVRVCVKRCIKFVNKYRTICARGYETEGGGREIFPGRYLLYLGC